jgi:hypothetical protein
MKTLLLVGVALTLLAAVSLSPAMAQGPQLSAGSSWPGVPPRVDPSASRRDRLVSRLEISPNLERSLSGSSGYKSYKSDGERGPGLMLDRTNGFREPGPY